MKKLFQEKRSIVFISTYPPRECGLATFTSDLVSHFDQLFSPREETKVVAMDVDLLQTNNYPRKVIGKIAQNEPEDYYKMADKLSAMPEVKLVSIQHEFGIYGDDYGKNILLFLERIKKPVAITLHTVLSSPDTAMVQLMKAIAEKVGFLIVMTQTSRKILEETYKIPAEKIRVIHHGIHALPFVDRNSVKSPLGLKGKKVLSTFGLLGRGKGIEFGISAMAQIVKEYPEAVYLIIGATHPAVLKQEGEDYRKHLMDEAYRLGVQDNVIFYNRYLKIEELLKFLQATDIYLSLGQNPDQAVSGTLTYALGAGRPVVSTSFMQAKEMITEEMGRLVGFNESDELAKTVIDLFRDPKRLTDMGKMAYFRTRGMTWSNVALSYMKVFIDLSPELAKKEKNLPFIKLQHLVRLTDKFGIFQFAKLDDPDPNWGYTLDDNARALIAVAELFSTSPSKTSLSLAKVYLGFLERALKEDGSFDNYYTFAKVPDQEKNRSEFSEDSKARALWALAVAASSKLPEAQRNKAEKIFEKQIETIENFSSPRAIAFLVKGLSILLSGRSDDRMYALLVENADKLLKMFENNSKTDWPWFEEILSYSNAVLPEALLLAHVATANPVYFEAGKASLDFLLKQSYDGDICSPVGQAGWFKKGTSKQLYDQQPEEVSALVLALGTMSELCREDHYRLKMRQAFDWFLGNNSLNQVVYSHSTGGCYDGLGEKHINLNQGAESTISYLLARLAVDFGSSK